ncbi:MAG: hypothetical protein ABUL42_02930 [Terricaulis silvestris]
MGQIPADLLSGQRIAVVYSFQAPDEPSDRWYDRWRTRVVMSYGEALERLGMHPYYCDIDTFCGQAIAKTLPGISAVISVNAGVRPISHFALVPAVAAWATLPIIPSFADAVIAGERKDLASLVAQHCGLQLPATFGAADIDVARREPLLIAKPRDLGGSVGIKIIAGPEIRPDDFQGGQIVQRFLPGYDVTIPVFFDYQNTTLTCGFGAIYVPDDPQPTSWYYSREIKEAYVGGTTPQNVRRVLAPVSPELARLIVGYCVALGAESFARLDFRLLADPTNLTSLMPEQVRFLEINPMPTVCSGLAFVDGIRQVLSRYHFAEMERLNLRPEDDYEVIAFILANALAAKLHPSEMHDGH